VGIRCTDYATPSIRKKLSLTSPTSGGRSVGIVRSLTGHGVIIIVLINIPVKKTEITAAEDPTH
jgi:hypothetical protein